MKKSAMLQALQALQKKPILILLILPIQVVSLISLAFLPDFSSLMNLNSLTSGSSSALVAFQASDMIYLLVNSFASLVSLAGMFVLIPPAIELLRDCAAGVETPAGWYARGLRKHWWKPIVSGLISGAIMFAFAFVLYIVLVVVMMVGSVGLAIGSSAVTLSTNSIMPIAVIVGVVFGLIIAVIMLVIEAFFALFLPALADRGFGESFKLLFSRKGLRKLPKLFGGLLLIALIPGILNAALMAGYLLIKGIPGDAMGLMTVLMNYMHSWPFILGMLFSGLARVVVYPFQFSVFQQVKDEEAAALVEQ